MTSIADSLCQKQIRLHTDFDLSACSSFRIGGRADYAVFPSNEQQMSEVISMATDFGIPFVVLGNCTNMLFRDEGFRGIVIFTEMMNRIQAADTRWTCDCGVSLNALSHKAAQCGLSGLEFACGIPGSVGGAVFMNAGAYGGQMEDVVIESRVINLLDGTVDTWGAKDHDFSYRSSALQDRKHICLSTVFSLCSGEAGEIRKTMQQNLKCRREKQPLNVPSAGSYFKRPKGHFAGELIEDCGLKGMAIGGAMVSEKHAGFLINQGGATCKDMLALEALIRDRVMDTFGVLLEREVRVFPEEGE